MAPALIDLNITDYVVPKKDTLGLPEPAYKRLTKAGIDLSEGYPYRPNRPLYLQDVYKIRNEDRPYTDPGARADKSKNALLSAATKVTDLTAHIGTEIEGLQLKDLTDQQKDELGLLIAERSVVFFRDQDLSPQQQRDLGEHYGEVEIHVGQPPFPDAVDEWCTHAKSTIASSTASSWRFRRHRHLAGPPSDRSHAQFSQAGRGISMAY
jgi:hypothetical protein